MLGVSSTTFAANLDVEEMEKDMYNQAIRVALAAPEMIELLLTELDVCSQLSSGHLHRTVCR